ncbi:MAG: TauD/TfdA family dioxygenase [Myxococcota bacterium]
MTTVPGVIAGSEPLPLLLTAEDPTLDLASWAADHRDALRTLLSRHGALLLRGFRAGGPAGFSRFAGTMCDSLFEGNGEHPAAPERGGLYVPVFYAPEQKLLWHNENSFNREWPARILFYAKDPARIGGSTPLVDGRRVLAALAPDVREKFTETGVRYVRNYGASLGLSWETVYGTADRATLERRCRAEGIDVAWRGDDLTTACVRPAVVCHPETGEAAWFAQIAHWHPAFLDPEVHAGLRSLVERDDDLPRTCSFGDGSPIGPEIVAHFREVHERLEVAVPWERDDVLVVDNVLVEHAREPFGGPRDHRVALGDLYRFGDGLRPSVACPSERRAADT